MTKICSKCNQEKDIERFPIKRVKRKDGSIHESRKNICNHCENRRKYEMKTNTPEKLAAYKLKANARRKKSAELNPLWERERQNIWVGNLIANGEFKTKWLWRKYKIHIEDYNDLLQKQNSSCAICGITELDYGKPLNVDHCHITGKVRGLLCHKCNLALGYYKDDIVKLRKAAQYLEDNS